MPQQRKHLPMTEMIVFTADLQIQKQLNKITPSDIEVKTIELSEKDFKVKTNLQTLLGINIKEEHEIVQSALLALGSFNQRLLEMEAYDAATILDDEDYALFDQKYKFLSNTLVKNDIQSKLSRVVNIIGLPNFSEVGGKYKINIEKLLKIKQSEELLIFRYFLKSITGIWCGMEIRFHLFLKKYKIVYKMYLRMFGFTDSR